MSNIKCGSYTGNGSTTGPTVTLGWEPQWLLTKRTSLSSSRWLIFDNERSPSNTRDDSLEPSDSGAELVNNANFRVDFNSTGFQIRGAGNEINSSGEDFIYVAIRKEGV